MSAEQKVGFPGDPLPRHDIQLGARFNPFEIARVFYEAPEGGETFIVSERYDHLLYLRRPVSLHGIDGRIDIISEEPLPVLSMWAVQAAGYMSYIDHPFGRIEKVTKFRDGKFDMNKNQAILRFSFLVKTPSEYAKLLRTYGTVTLGEEDFLLNFAVNQKFVQKGLKRLEQGKQLLAVEKNLFSERQIEEITEKYGLESEEGEGEGSLLIASPPKKRRRECPSRIAFVDLPVDLETFRSIAIVFQSFDGFGEAEYPTQPIQPNRKPIPVLA